MDVKNKFYLFTSEPVRAGTQLLPYCCPTI